MTKSLSDMIAEADRAIRTYEVREAEAALRAGEAIFVDVRERSELCADGTIPGALHIPRGVLEFHTLPESLTYVAALNSDKPVILFCASGGRSALAGQSLQNLGREHVGHVAGGFSAWVAEGRQVETVTD